MSRLTKLIAPSFYTVHNDIKADRHTHYFLKGGRGSTKSSFVSLEIIMGMMSDPDSNAVAIRKVGTYLKDSVYNQLVWAIEHLGVYELWSYKKSLLEIEYKPTGQRILFRGADKPQKLKSTKAAKGYIKYIWFEECAEFNGMDEIRSITQSLMRGGEVFKVFYSYNPPKTQRNWINKEVLETSKSRFIHHSDYRAVPGEWLGNEFIKEAEDLKRRNPDLYEHEYLGEVTGTGGTVFPNCVIREITDAEIESFDRIKRGIDFGFAADPFVYVIGHYDKKHKKLYLFDEIYKCGLFDEKAAELIKAKGEYRQVIMCDSAQPQSISKMRQLGLNVRGAKKGKDSIEFGIKFLQSLDEIVIDSKRCPKTAEEFYSYELEPDGNDGFKDGYPDKNNHSIDAVRYAMEDESVNRKGRVVDRKEWGL